MEKRKKIIDIRDREKKHWDLVVDTIIKAMDELDGI